MRTPFPFFNQSPLVGVYGLPAARGAGVLAAAEQSLAFHLDYSSHYVDRANADESLVLDGETTRAALVYRRGLGAGFEARVAVPFIDHSGGIADGFIDGFHDVTGFADGGRSTGPHDRQLYRYTRNGETRLNVDGSPTGLGDMRLGLARGWALSPATRTSLNAALKLPTGDADRLTGSGAADLALWAALDMRPAIFDAVSLVAALGGLYTGEGDVLADQRRRGAAFGWLTLGYDWTRNLVLQTQIYVHTPLYQDSRFDAVEGVAVQGAAGFGWRFGPASRLQMAIIEDLNLGVSPDVSFNVSLSRRF